MRRQPVRQQYAVRSLILIAGLALVALAVIVQMLRIQNSEQAQLFIAQGDRYAGEFNMIYPDRGEIYDRSGHLLAGNRTVYEVGVDLNAVKDADAIAKTVSLQLGLDYNTLYQSIVNPPPG